MSKLILSAFADEYADGFSEQLEALVRFGIGFIELRFIDGINISDLSKAQTADVRAKLKHYGIGVSAIGSPLGKIPLDGDMEAHIEKAKNVFETANALGTKNVRFFSFYPPNDGKITDCRDEVYENLERLICLAEQYGITLCHENEARIYGESPENCLELMKTFAGRIKCVFDMGNFVLDSYTPYPDAYNVLAEYTEYFHIKDALYAGAIVPPGKGEASIYEILKTHTEKAEKDTFVSLEPHLQTFSGLNALVGKQFENLYQYPDKKTAFADAVRCLKDIINNIQTV